MKPRRNDSDVTGTVCIADPWAVREAVGAILARRYPGLDLAAVHAGFELFARLYAGDLPGYLGCDTLYHDAQHSLDCCLALTRLIDGHEGAEPPRSQLGPRRAVLGVLIALFHDAGYIRRVDDSAASGAEYTLCHVRRSGDFLAGHLPPLGFGREVPLARRLVHYTGYEIALDEIAVRGKLDRRLGFMLGTADVVAQVSDRSYLEKCRDFLFREFTQCGLAGGPGARYASPEDLLRKTPQFHRHLCSERLDGYFGSVHRYMAEHFGGRNPYQASMDAQLRRLQDAIESDDLGRLRRRPRVVGATAMRRRLDVRGERGTAGTMANEAECLSGDAAALECRKTSVSRD